MPLTHDSNAILLLSSWMADSGGLKIDLHQHAQIRRAIQDYRGLGEGLLPSCMPASST